MNVLPFRPSARIPLLLAALLTWASPASATFSIIARDPATGELGLAVASRVLAVGSHVAWIEADVGAVARQSNVIFSYGRRAMELLRAGRTAEQVLADLLRERPSPDHQLAIIDAKGNIAVSTGPEATEWKGHKRGDTYSVQGNILVGPQVIDAMARAFETTKGELAERLFAALKAGDDAGGDKRGRQSAHIVVVKRNGGVGEGHDRVVDLSVEDHPTPLIELRRLLNQQLAWNLSGAAGDAWGKGQLREAKTLLQQATAYAPDVAAFPIYLGFLTYLMGEKDEALRHFQTARSLKEFQSIWDEYKTAPEFKAIYEDDEFVKKVFAK